MAFGALVRQRVRIRSEMLQAALHNTGMFTEYKQTQNPWLLSVNLPTVQTPCTDSTAFQIASLCGEGSQRHY